MQKWDKQIGENMYDTVIFDLDGTLLNTIDDIAAAVQYAQKKYGFPVHTVDEVKKHVGNGLRLLMAPFNS